MSALALPGPRTLDRAREPAPRWVTTVVRPVGAVTDDAAAEGWLAVVRAGAALGGTVLVDLSACDVLAGTVLTELARAASTAERAGGVLLVVDPDRRQHLAADVVLVDPPWDAPAAGHPLPPARVVAP